MSEVHEGGCLCGAVRYRVRGEPARNSACHCTFCGGTVTWTVEAAPGLRAFAGGSFDDPQWFRITRHGWLRSAHGWFKPPEGVDLFERGTLPTPPKK